MRTDGALYAFRESNAEGLSSSGRRQRGLEGLKIVRDTLSFIFHYAGDTLQGVLARTHTIQQQCKHLLLG